jgi:hypothetical protein
VAWKSSWEKLLAHPSGDAPYCRQDLSAGSREACYQRTLRVGMSFLLQKKPLNQWIAFEEVRSCRAAEVGGEPCNGAAGGDADA